MVPITAPALSKLGVDPIWLGVMIGMNLQASFLTPPFGFALFYLRSVAPREAYIDKVTGKSMEPVTTGQIYWGAIPFVVIQCIMVALIIAFPALVTYDKPAAEGSGPQIDIQQMLKDDAGKAGNAANDAPPPPAQDDDALMKSLGQPPAK